MSCSGIMEVLAKHAEEQPSRKLTLLDCFCGMGGVSDGFAMEGFDVMGIDIVDAPKMLGYKHRFIEADMMSLKGEDFRGYDVIWGSPPCRDFSQLGVLYGKKWKDKPDPERGLKLIDCFLDFVQAAKPQFWIMENIRLLKKYFTRLKPRSESYILYGKCHVFYGNYPLFLMPRDMRYRIRTINKHGRDEPLWNGKDRSFQAAKIPLACSRAFARACKEKLLEMTTE